MKPVLCMLAALLSGCTVLRPHAWPAGSGKIVLTFDDGPNPATTEKLLAALRKHDVPATFCFIGCNVDAHPELAREALEDGHEIANHTWHHSRSSLLSSRAFAQELADTDEAISTASSPFRARYVRPPFGLVPPAVRKACENREIAWLTFFVDDSGASAATFRKKLDAIKSQLLRHNGGAIVLHEMRFISPEAPNGPDKSWLPVAADELITWSKARGFTFSRYSDAPPGEE